MAAEPYLKSLRFYRYDAARPLKGEICFESDHLKLEMELSEEDVHRIICIVAERLKEAATSASHDASAAIHRLAQS